MISQCPTEGVAFPQATRAGYGADSFAVAQTIGKAPAEFSRHGRSTSAGGCRLVLLRCAGAFIALGGLLSLHAPPASASSLPRANPASGPVRPLRSLGGPELVDQDGRTVLLHGVDLVYKVPPYEVEVQGTGRNVLTPHEAQRMAQLGFNIVRLGIIWRGSSPAPTRSMTRRSHTGCAEVAWTR